jgi:hypothetical protein
MLATDNVEKVPSNQRCSVGKEDPACAPGFFGDRRPGAPGAPGGPGFHACCNGYFCPIMLTCMMPCPLGAYCPR